VNLLGYNVPAFDQRSNAEKGYVKTYTQRAATQKSIRANTRKLINKAQANVQAFKKGVFGAGH